MHRKEQCAQALANKFDAKFMPVCAASWTQNTEIQTFFTLAHDLSPCLVFISEDWRVELTAHKDASFGRAGEHLPLVRVRIYKKALDGDFVAGHYEDFELDNVGELATQIERYVQFAVGTRIREQA